MKRLLSTLILVAGLSTWGYSQHIDVHGKVTDTNGEILVGATVQVLNSVVGTFTDTEGKFELEIAPGRIRMVASYVGYARYDTLLELSPNADDVTLNIVMQPRDFDITEIVVTGRRSTGQLEAITQQQQALSRTQILHAEVFNRFPDNNLAETVRRMPGVSLDQSGGRAEFIRLGGLPQDYVVTQLNGQRLPSIRPEAPRAASLDFIQSNLLEEVVVCRSRTADQDADAVAGLVDFRLRQPDEKLELLAQAAGGIYTGGGERVLSRGIYQASVAVNSELSEEKVFGLFAINSQRVDRGIASSDFGYGPDLVSGSNIGQIRAGETDIQNDDFGLLGSIELRPSIFNRLRLSYNLSNTTEIISRRRALFNQDGDQIRRETANWRDNRRLNLVTLEVENNFEKTKLDYQISFARSREDVRNRYRFSYLADWEGQLEDPLSVSPADEISGGPLRLFAVEPEHSKLEEDIAIGSVNITRFLNERQTAFAKVGGRIRSKRRTFGLITSNNFIDSGGATISPGTFGNTDIDGNADFTDQLGLLEALDADPFESEASFRAEEDIVSAYLMFGANLSSRLSFTSGLRYEQTELDFENLATDFRDEDTYDNLFPSAQLTYRFNENKQLRMAYFQAINRAPYLALAREELLFGNRESLVSNLETLGSRVDNIDLSLEFYSQEGNFISISTFAKWIDQPIISQMELSQISSPTEFASRRLSNANQAVLLGAELGVIHNLGFLSSDLPAGARQAGLRGMNAFLSYSYTYSDITDDNSVFDGQPLPGAPRQTANLGLNYRSPEGKWNAVIATTYSDLQLDRFENSVPVYTADQFTLDLAVDRRLGSQWALFLRANNLTDHTFESYLGAPTEDGSRIYERFNYGRWFLVGIRYKG
ncbi:MAG: TonB-dependent receptor [Bacteroidota bacterium]